MMRKLLPQVPFILAALIFLVALTVITQMSCRLNDGHMAYTVDDAYIHMAMAKNLSAHGVLGVTRFEFSSSTSSPLWTLLLAMSYKLFGVSDWTPGILATVFAIATLYATNVLGRMFNLAPLSRFITCCAVLYFTPLVALVSIGMEHAMHIFLTFVLIIWTLRFMESPSRKALGFLCITALLATFTRYESLFLVAPIALCLLMKRHWFSASLLVLFSLLPVIAYGAYSVTNGSYFLPNSVMLKGNFHSLDSPKSLIKALGYNSLQHLCRVSHLYSLVLFLLLGGFLAGKRREPLILVGLSLVGAVFLHLQFAKVGWFYRYEAYLAGISVAVVGCLCGTLVETSLRNWKNREQTLPRIALLAFVSLLIWPLFDRGTESLMSIGKASNHIYSQQYQMGQFLRTMYDPGVRVAVNDLGAVTYYADPEVLDLIGLGTNEVTHAQRNGLWNTELIEQFLQDRKIDVVIVYESWFRNERELPSHLIHVADWTTVNSFWGPTVAFLASTEDEANTLRTRLHRYQKNLPDSVEVNYTVPSQGSNHDE